MSYKGTPASSQIIWLEQRVEQLESGPGGIMEMKQTIADKERRIEELERVLWDITMSARLVGDYLHVKMAREALQGKTFDISGND